MMEIKIGDFVSVNWKDNLFYCEVGHVDNLNRGYISLDVIEELQNKGNDIKIILKHRKQKEI